MMRNILCGAAVILSGLCGSAQAAPLLGTVNSGPNSIDTGGLFGPVGASLAGDRIAVTFEYNGPYPFSPPTGTGLFLGGLLEIIASINGRTVAIDNTNPTAPPAIIIDPTETTFNTGQGNGGNDSAFLSLATDPTSTITSIVALTGPASSGDNIGLFFPFGLFPGDNPKGDTLDFTLTPATAVPEPGSLALFATGLLGLGIVARRRRPGSGVTPMG